MTSLHNQSTAQRVPVYILTLPTKREKEILLRRCKQMVQFGNIIILAYSYMKHGYLLKTKIGVSDGKCGLLILEWSWSYCTSKNAKENAKTFLYK